MQAQDAVALSRERVPYAVGQRVEPGRPQDLPRQGGRPGPMRRRADQQQREDEDVGAVRQQVTARRDADDHGRRQGQERPR